MTIGRRSILVRAMCSVFLLLLLGVCGYAGARQGEVKTVSAPIVREVMAQETYSSATTEETRLRLEQKRKEEIALLDSVIGQSDPGSQSREDALLQKTQIVQRMETEAGAEASLAYMGYDRAAVVCGAQSVTVFAPFDQAGNEKARMQMIDAAAGASGFSAEAVKIILTKK